jgi:hypothetical protein
MDSTLPATGTVELLDLISPFVPDDFINRTWPQTPTGGRRRQHSAAQLVRVHLLSLLTPVHSLNLLVRLLPEQSGWRRFARLRNRCQGPDVRMLHEFRTRMGVAGFREINAHLSEPLVERYAWRERSVGLIDATDLPAACGGFKKKYRALLGSGSGAGRANAQDRAEPLLCRL